MTLWHMALASLTHCLKCEMNIFQMRIFEKITLFLFLIHSFIELKVLVSLPKIFYGLLGN